MAEIMKSIINVKYSLNYEDADQLIDYAPREEDDLLQIYRILKKRIEYRISNGAIDLQQSKGKLKTIDDKKKVFISI